MEGAAKSAAEAVFRSDYPLIVMAAIFLAFVGFCVWVILKRQAQQDEASQKRDDTLIAKLEKIVEDSDRKWEDSAKRMTEATQESDRRAEAMGNHFIDLLTTTVGAMNSLGESVRRATEESAKASKDSAANIARLEQAIEKKADKKVT